MGTVKSLDPEGYDAVLVAAVDVYRRVAGIVGPRLTEGLIAGAGQTISDAEWFALTVAFSDAYGDVFLDAVIAGGTEFRILPNDDRLMAALDAQQNASASLAPMVRDLLDQFLQDALLTGMTGEEVRDRLFGSPSSPLNPRKAEMMARTAVNTAANAGFDAAFREAGVPAVSWITQRDDRVREAHVAADRDIVKTGMPFMIGGFEARYPGDPQLPIGLRINCRCILGWVDGGQVKRAVDGSRAELRKMARSLEIPGRSTMRKPELQIAVIESLCLQGLAGGTDCPDVLGDMNMATLLTHARMADIKGRYRMRRPELLARVEAAYTATPTSGIPIQFAVSATAAPQAELTVLADDVINGTPVNVHEEVAVDLVEILGRHTEPVDLTLVRVTGELFGKVADNGLTREEMPQIPDGHVDEFRAFLKAAGVKVEMQGVDPLDLFATQSELDARKVGKMVTAIRNDQFEPDSPAFVSSDGRILDGHHRWAAQALLCLAGLPEITVCAVTNVPIDDLLNRAAEFAALNDIQSKAHGMSWDASKHPRHGSGSYQGGRWMPHYGPDGSPYQRVDSTVRPSVFDPDQASAVREERDRVRSYREGRATVETPNRAQLERFEDTFGKGIESIFPADSFSVTTIPFPSAGRRKGEPLYDKAAVAETLARPPQLSSFDPRTLHATQPGVTRDGVDYYVNDAEYKATGETYADRDQVGNQYPVIYRNPTSGQLVILSGHHRSTAALVSGRPVRGILVDPRVKVIR